MLAAYVNALGDLAGPKRALPMLQDTARLNAYAAGIKHALKLRPGDFSRMSIMFCNVFEL